MDEQTREPDVGPDLRAQKVGPFPRKNKVKPNQQQCSSLQVNASGGELPREDLLNSGVLTSSFSECVSSSYMHVLIPVLPAFMCSSAVWLLSCCCIYWVLIPDPKLLLVVSVSFEQHSKFQTNHSLHEIFLAKFMRSRRDQRHMRS